MLDPGDFGSGKTLLPLVYFGLAISFGDAVTATGHLCWRFSVLGDFSSDSIRHIQAQLQEQLLKVAQRRVRDVLMAHKYPVRMSFLVYANDVMN